MKLTHKKKPSLEKGVHLSDVGVKKGPSYVGQLVREGAPKRHIEDEHTEALRELRSMPKPHGEFAKGGEVCGTCGYAHGGEIQARAKSTLHKGGRGGGSHVSSSWETGGSRVPRTSMPAGTEDEMRKIDMQTGKYKMHGPKGELYAHGGKVHSERDLEKEHDRKEQDLIERLAKKIPLEPHSGDEPWPPRGSAMTMTKTRAPFAHGGTIESRRKERMDTKGVNMPAGHEWGNQGISTAGENLRIKSSEYHQAVGKKLHKDSLEEQRSMKKPHLYAEGGEVEGQSQEIDTLENMDDELQGLLGQELMESFEKKDHKGVMKSIEAIIRTCLSKE